ncbi:MAG: RecX family transcriptional regulator [Elusimicrobiota bacterium]
MYKIFVEGDFAFELSDSIIKEKKLRAGLSLSERDIEKLKINDSYFKALDYARLLLSYRIRSEKEIVIKLNSKKYPAKVIDAVLKKLKDYQELDDRKFAVAWIHSRRASRPKGDYAIRKELKEKGVSDDEIEYAFKKSESESPCDKTELAVRACGSMLQKYKKLDKNTARRRLRSLLKRRGFSYDTIAEVESRFFNEQI